jgi:hypothetical protein
MTPIIAEPATPATDPTTEVAMTATQCLSTSVAAAAGLLPDCTRRPCRDACTFRHPRRIAVPPVALTERQVARSIQSWDDAAAALGRPEQLTAFQKARLTFAATIAHGLSLLGAREMERTVIWIIGAREATEGELARNGELAEPLAAMCPSMGQLELWLIGPEMRNWRLEGGAPRPGDPRTVIKAVSGTLHSVGRAADQPDYVVLFNSGVGTLTWSLVESWLPTLLQLVELNVPLLLTCFNEQEAVGQTALLKEAFAANVLHALRRNPLAHVAPSKPEFNVHAAFPDATGISEKAAASALDQAAALDDAATVAAEAARAQAARVRPPARPAFADPFALPLAFSASAYEAHIAQQLISSMQSVQQLPAPGEVDPMLLFCGRAHRYVMWVRGTALPSRLQSGIHRGRAFLKAATQHMAPQNMDAWVAGLDRPVAAENAEEVSWNAMLLGGACCSARRVLVAPRAPRPLSPWASRPRPLSRNRGTLPRAPGVRTWCAGQAEGGARSLGAFWRRRGRPDRSGGQRGQRSTQLRGAAAGEAHGGGCRIGDPQHPGPGV